MATKPQKITVAAKIDKDVRAKLVGMAAQQELKLSDIIRKALRAYTEAAQ